MHRSAPLALLAPLAVLLVVLLVPAGAQAKGCDISGKERKLGPTYVTSLSVKGVSCASAERVVKSYHECRYASGGKAGRCTKKVRGYSCRERRGAAIPTQYDATVTCKRGSRKITHRYEQYT